MPTDFLAISEGYASQVTGVWLNVADVTPLWLRWSSLSLGRGVKVWSEGKEKCMSLHKIHEIHTDMIVK